MVATCSNCCVSQLRDWDKINLVAKRSNNDDILLLLLYEVVIQYNLLQQYMFDCGTLARTSQRTDYSPEHYIVL